MNLTEEYTKSIINRLLQNSVSNAVTGCWEWLRHKDKDGYGHIKIKRTTERAHRVSLHLIGGEDIKDKLVLHSCDNPSCINPEHLRVGSYEENMEDMLLRGRAGNRIHENHNKAKLTWGDVRDIRARYSVGDVSQQSLGDEYGVSQFTISSIIRGKTWVEQESNLWQN